MSTTVKGVYAHLDCLVDGIAAVKKAGYLSRTMVAAPLPRHEIEDLMYDGKPSPIRWFTLFGAFFGGMSGFSVASITHLNWPMIIPAGKPLVSIPAFIVITFESTVLYGCIFTLIGMLIMAKLPARKLKEELKDVRYSDDHFGLVVEGLSVEDAKKVEAALSHSGAIEVSAKEDGHA